MTSTGPKSRVLLVDDDRESLLRTSALFPQRYEVVIATSPAEAIQVLRRGGVEVLCTSYRMPGMNGLQLLEEAVRENPFLWGILITTYGDLADPMEPRGSIPYYLLIRPFHQVQLCDLLQRAVRSARARQEAVELSRQLRRLSIGG